MFGKKEKETEYIINQVNEKILDLENKTQILESANLSLYEKNSDLLSQISDLKCEAEKTNNKFENYIQQLKDDLWITKYTYDNMMAELQMQIIEELFPGNRDHLKDLKNSHDGETCFVIGNGPSLKAEDLEQIMEKKIFSFASNGIYKIFNNTNWRPDIWGVSDLDFIQTKHHEINELQQFPKLVCAQSVIQRGITVNDAIYYPFIQAERNPRFFNADIMKGVHFYNTVSCKLINFAVYMGFKKIYLLGCDSTFPTKKLANGKKVIDSSQKTHFSDEYYNSEQEANKVFGGIDDIEKSVEEMMNSYKDIKYYCKNLNIEILNATRGGALEVFQRIHFENIIN